MSELSIVRNPPVPEEIYTVDGNSYKYYASAEVSASPQKYPTVKMYTIGRIPINNIEQIVRAEVTIQVGVGTFYYASASTGIAANAFSNRTVSNMAVGEHFYFFQYGALDYAKEYGYIGLVLSANGEILVSPWGSPTPGNRIDIGEISGTLRFWLL